MTTPAPPAVPRPTVYPLGQLAAESVAAHGQLADSHGQAANAAAAQLQVQRETKAQRRLERIAALRARDHSAANPDRS